jgi:hypothetical protein
MSLPFDTLKPRGPACIFDNAFRASYAPHNHDGIRSDSKLNGKSDLTEGDNEHIGRNRKYAKRKRYKGIVREPCK